MKKIHFVAVVLSGLAIVSEKALSGPPLICHPIHIGTAHSLPSGTGPFGTKVDYDRSGLVEETLELLTAEMPVLVRMETLRRATLYASGIYRGNNNWTAQSEESRRIAYELLSRLMARTLQVDAGGKSAALAWFDVGYLMACYEQANVAKEFPGYELVKKALVLRGEDGEMEFACAMVTLWPKRAEHGQYVQKTRAAAKNNSLLALNIQEHFGNEKSQ